jgi:hypothetical protein
MIVPTIGKDSAAKFSNISRGLDPARGPGIKFSKFLQRSILLFIQKLDSHSGSKINSVSGRVNAFLFPFSLPFAIVTDAPAAVRTFC